MPRGRTPQGIALVASAAAFASVLLFVLACERDASARASPTSSSAAHTMANAASADAARSSRGSAVAGAAVNDAAASVESSSHDSFAGSAACASCHAAEHAAWRSSRHAHAMSAATAAPDDALAALAGFGAADLRWSASERGVLAEGKAAGNGEHALHAWLGIAPLAQPLVVAQHGRVQPLPFGWNAASGRWVALDAPSEAFVGGMQPAAWHSREACANTQCLFCHTTGFERGASRDVDGFDSRWNELGVACEACHGPASAHVEWQRAHATSNNGATASANTSASAGTTTRSTRATGATGSTRAPDASNSTRAAGAAASPNERDPTLAALRVPSSREQADLCAACHARRAELAEGWRAGAPLLDHFRPELPSSPAYHANGVAHGEAFEWGSFRQSAMHAAGVRCSDCHEPHGAALRARGNDLCLRCHASSFNEPSHTRHAPSSRGASCEACHMPRTTYLALDDRADHAFSIPRPLLEAELGIPSACGACHADRSPQWAAAALADAREPAEIVVPSAPVRALTTSAQRAARRADAAKRARDVAAARAGHGANEWMARLSSATEPELWRAAAAELLGAHAERADVRKRLLAAIRDASGLVREASLAALRPARADEVAAIATLLGDPLRAVRCAAVAALATQRASVSAKDAAAFERARAEWLGALELAADAPDGLLAFANALQDLGEVTAAERRLERALELDASFAYAAVNLGTLRAQRGDRAGARAALERALELAPELAAAHLALGLWWAEEPDVARALRELERAVELDAELPRARYNLAVLYWQAGSLARAEPLLRAEWAARPTQEVRDALASLCEQSGRVDEARVLRAVELER